jgi:hypothetical protein
MPPARLLVSLSTLLALACGRTAVPSGEPQKAEAMSPTPTDGPASPPDADAAPDAASTAAASPDATAASCVAVLRALAAGDYRGWRGVPAACTIADADRALGAAGPPQTGFPGGSPTRYRTYPPSAGAPAGLQIYDVDGAITLIIARDAVPADTLDAMLGAPEAKQASRMPGFKTMWIWASRGLTLHRDDTSGAVAWLYGYSPMTVDAFRASWLAKVEIHRTRVR